MTYTGQAGLQTCTAKSGAPLVLKPVHHGGGRGTYHDRMVPTRYCPSSCTTQEVQYNFPLTAYELIFSSDGEGKLSHRVDLQKKNR